jgi:dTDP-4-dehydrorhamnose reductase
MIILLGSSGFIGSEFKRQMPYISCIGREKVRSFDYSRTSLVINCVGECADQSKMLESNIEFPIWLAKKVKCKLIHIGTTVVGDYWYGITKAFADEAIKRISKNYTIYRLPWLEGNDFTKYVSSCNEDGVPAKIYNEHGYPATRERCVKYIVNNLSRHSNDIVALGGKPRTKAGWATDMFPNLKYESISRDHSYECIKPTVVI